MARVTFDFFIYLAATWVGGGYIMSCAEMVYNPTKGLVWVTAPVACAMNMLLGKLEREKKKV